jgi:probable F420-dependent oxidoreductase
MRVSLTIFGFDTADCAAIAREAEQSGYDAIWLTDHLVVPARYESTYPYDPSGRPGGLTPDVPLPDVWVTIGYLSGCTSRLQLGTGVFILPLRNPLVTARAAATAQTVSRGRLVMGIGTGWMREEFDTVGEDFDNRGRRTDEIIDILRQLWTGQPVTYRGRFYEFQDLQLSPGLAVPPPIVMGGLTKVALRRAARLGDGWFAPRCTLTEALAARHDIDRLRADAQREHLPFRYYARVSDPADEAAISAALEAGFADLVIPAAAFVPPGDAGVEAQLAGLRDFALRHGLPAAADRDEVR